MISILLVSQQALIELCVLQNVRQIETVKQKIKYILCLLGTLDVYIILLVDIYFALSND